MSMARPIRIEFKNAFYHVMNRGRGRQNIFHGVDYYHIFLQCLNESYQRFGLEIHCYCMMDNHYHLLVKTPHGNLSRAMRHINGLYTQRYNRLKRTDGPLFRGRYKSILIDASSYLLQVSRYIHRNPIETRRRLVEKLEDYRWSSYPLYFKKQKIPDWLFQDGIFAELGTQRSYKTYRTFVESGNDREIDKFYGSGRVPSILGDKLFRENALAGVDLSGERVAKETKPVIESEAIIQSVQNLFGCERQAILKSVRGRQPRNYARWMAMKLCQTQGQLRLTDIARKFNVGNYCTVSQTIRRLNLAMAEENELAQKYNTISKDLTLKRPQ